MGNGRKRILLIPLHFPPIQGSTGAARSFEFARWLPEFGWDASVITVHPMAYPDKSDDVDQQLPEGTTVTRVFALDAKRHLSIGGRYLKFTGLPDRWSSWFIGGVICGLLTAWKRKPDIIYTTYPVPTSHLIGFVVHKLTGIPWIAEFRDPMVEEAYPEDPVERKIRVRIERAIFKSACRVVTVTPSAKEYYDNRAARGENFAVEIPNGYSDSLKDVIKESCATNDEAKSAVRTILHSGFLYEDVRNPLQLLEAIRELKVEQYSNLSLFRFVFRGSGNDDVYRRMVDDLEIGAFVEFREAITYTDAYRELTTADALMLLQGRKCNRQIPAKFYEYCALQKPILNLSDPNGDTGRLFESLGLGKSVALEDCDSIKRHLPEFLESVLHGSAKVPGAEIVSGMSRRARAKELAALLDDCLS